MHRKQQLFLLFLFIATSITCASAKEIACKIRVAQYAKQLKFKLLEGGRWETDNQKGNIPANASCKISGKLLQKAVKKFHVMVGSAESNDIEKIKELEKKFIAKNFRPYRFEVGTKSEIYPAKTLTYIGIANFAKEDEAKAFLDKLSSQQISSWIFPELINQAKGNLRLEYARKKIQGNAFKIIPNGKIVLKQVEFAKGYSWHGFEDRTYKGPVKFCWGSDDLIDSILTINLEDLIAGIVPSEISPKAPDEAIKAQAVAARGEMLSKKGIRHYKQGYDFCSEQHCQVFKGQAPYIKRIARIIKPTRGLIIETADGKILDAVYGANCGGHTASNHKIWTSNPNPHLSGVSDVKGNKTYNLTDNAQAKEFILNPPACYCSVKGIEGSNKFRWKKKLSAKQWKKIEADLNIGRIKTVSEFKREISGRIYSLVIKGEKGEKTILKELPIRRLFGGLRSSCFIAKWHKDKQGYIYKADFNGAGWGHGVGMCQTGAQSMGKMGISFKKILLHYFPGTKLRKLY